MIRGRPIKLSGERILPELLGRRFKADDVHVEARGQAMTKFSSALRQEQASHTTNRTPSLAPPTYLSLSAVSPTLTPCFLLSSLFEPYIDVLFLLTTVSGNSLPSNSGISASLIMLQMSSKWICRLVVRLNHPRLTMLFSQPL